MASFNIKSAFTNITLTKTLNLCVQNLCRNQVHVNNLTKISFYKLLKITILESFFIFDGKFYEQCDGVAMIPLYDLHQLMYLSVILKTFGWENDQVISN